VWNFIVVYQKASSYVCYFGDHMSQLCMMVLDKVSEDYISGF
jgi:hypothetical protein